MSQQIALWPSSDSDSDCSTLAQGAFGKIYKKLYKGHWAAMKKVPRDAVAKKDLKREYKVYKKATCGNVIQVLGPFIKEEDFYVIPLEFIFGEDLETTIFNEEESRIQLTPPVTFLIITGMCTGLEYLHSKDIVHQDLKPDNIKVEHRTNRAVIVDLGLAKFFKDGLNSARDMGNMAYSAPEVLQGEQRDQRSDVWAMGKIIAELYLMDRLKRREVKPSTIRERMKKSFYCNTVCEMVHPDPEERATMAKVLKHLWKKIL